VQTHHCCFGHSLLIDAESLGRALDLELSVLLEKKERIGAENSREESGTPRLERPAMLDRDDKKVTLRYVHSRRRRV